MNKTRRSVGKLSAVILNRYGVHVPYPTHSAARRDGLLPMLEEQGGKHFFNDEDVPEIARALGILPEAEAERPESRSRSATAVQTAA